MRGFVVSLAIALGIGVASAQSEVATDLKRWAGKDQMSASPSDPSFFSLIERFYKTDLWKRSIERLKRPHPGNAYAWVWKLKSNPDQFVIYFVPGTPTFSVASRDAWLIVVDPKGDALSESHFTLGWRQWNREATFEKVPWLESPVIVQKIAANRAGWGARKMYIGFDGVQPRVVRRDDVDGSIEPTDYNDSQTIAGPVFVPDTTRQIDDAMFKSNEVRRIGLLLWLSGSHGRLQHEDYPLHSESPSHRALYDSCMNSPVVDEWLGELKKSPNPYLRHLAKMVPLHDGLYSDELQKREDVKWQRWRDGRPK